ncbi:MAG: hypothetical protein Q8920_13135, partial [Bacillota bacterium]|nr:hypothetical protein [Bacillota bacterium]
DIDSYQNQTNRNRVGKYDGMTVFDSKQYKWSVKVPGNWIKSLSSDGSYVSFFENELGLSIGVEAVENNSDNKTAADDEKFSFMGAIENNDGVELKNQTTVTDKGKTINIYDYRWEDSAEEIFADVQFKVIDGKDYSYCYFSIMPDELKCSANVSLISDIWNSFTLED